jgi:hypothetical protein
VAQYPQTIQSALLFDKSKPLDLDAFAQEFIASEAAAGTNYNVVFDTNPGVFYRLYGSNDVMITIELLGKPANLPVFERTLNSPFTKMMTPGGRDLLTQHRAHVLVGVHHGVIPEMKGDAGNLLKQLNVLPGNTLTAFKERLLLCERLSLRVHRKANASLVHWTQSDMLLTGAAFEKLAGSEAPSPLHVHPLLFDGGQSADGKRQVTIRTLGASHFIGQDIHIAPNPIPWADCHEHLFGFIRFALLKDGYIIPDGHTFGPDDDSFSYWVRHIPSGEKSDDFDGPLYRMELLHSQKAAFQSPDYINPRRTFDDRNMPSDVKAGLGGEAPKVEQELRARREMAERAGARFEVRAPLPGGEKQPGKNGLRRWLSFGKGRKDS